MATTLDSKNPVRTTGKKWEKHRIEPKLVNPNNKRKFDIIVVGSGLAGGSAATLAELGYSYLNRLRAEYSNDALFSKPRTVQFRVVEFL